MSFNDIESDILAIYFLFVNIFRYNAERYIKREKRQQVCAKI